MSRLASLRETQSSPDIVAKPCAARVKVSSKQEKSQKGEKSEGGKEGSSERSRGREIKRDRTAVPRAVAEKGAKHAGE